MKTFRSIRDASHIDLSPNSVHILTKSYINDLITQALLAGMLKQFPQYRSLDRLVLVQVAFTNSKQTTISLDRSQTGPRPPTCGLMYIYLQDRCEPITRRKT